MEEWYTLEEPDTGAAEKLRQQGIVVGLLATGASATSNYVRRKVDRLRKPLGTPVIGDKRDNANDPTSEQYGDLLMRGKAGCNLYLSRCGR